MENFKRLTRRALQRARRAQPENKEILWSEYRLIRKEYKKLITNTKTQSWQQFCTNTETLSATARLNKLLCKNDQNNIEWIKKSDGNAATQPQDILSVLLDTHFPGNFHYPFLKPIPASPLPYTPLPTNLKAPSKNPTVLCVHFWTYKELLTTPPQQ